MEHVVNVFGALVCLFIAYNIGRERGHGKGYSEGYELARGWRDEALEKWQALAKEALQQRDEARSNRVVLPPPPNPFASKEWN